MWDRDLKEGAMNQYSIYPGKFRMPLEYTPTVCPSNKAASTLTLTLTPAIKQGMYESTRRRGTMIIKLSLSLELDSRKQEALLAG